ncbi:hypothetical protein B0H13DRAFT_2384397 [Mycena leptocephala]|nr:hypothetical protein B0H13DRAFT_2384397 [Mycena leptocephala]
MPIPASTRSVYPAPAPWVTTYLVVPTGRYPPSDFSERIRLLLSGAPRWLRPAHSPIRLSSCALDLRGRARVPGRDAIPVVPHARTLRPSRKRPPRARSHRRLIPPLPPLPLPAAVPSSASHYSAAPPTHPRRLSPAPPRLFFAYHNRLTAVSPQFMISRRRYRFPGLMRWQCGSRGFAWTRGGRRKMSHLRIE